jgi:hypothetical protein
LGIGQAVFWALSPAPLVVNRRDRDFAHAQLINGQRVKGKNLPWSNHGSRPLLDSQKILIAVATLDAAPMALAIGPLGQYCIWIWCLYSP